MRLTAFVVSKAIWLPSGLQKMDLNATAGSGLSYIRSRTVWPSRDVSTKCQGGSRVPDRQAGSSCITTAKRSSAGAKRTNITLCLRVLQFREDDIEILN